MIELVSLARLAHGIDLRVTSSNRWGQGTMLPFGSDGRRRRRVALQAQAIISFAVARDDGADN